MDALVEAAKAEGELNVIALPDNWANYGEIIDAFEAEYDITVNSASPDVSSAEEITAAAEPGGPGHRPRRLRPRLGRRAREHRPVRALQGRRPGTTSPTTTRSRPASGSTTTRGLMSIGYDADAVPEPTSLDDLLGADYKGKVAINGDPTQAGAAVAAVGCAAVQDGGSARRLPARHRLLRRAARRGQLPADRPDPGDHRLGRDPGRLRLELQQPRRRGRRGRPRLEDRRPARHRATPATTTRRSTSTRRTRPPRACGRSSSSATTAQNLYLAAGAYPVRLAAMAEAGTVDQDALDAVGEQPEDTVAADRASRPRPPRPCSRDVGRGDRLIDDHPGGGRPPRLRPSGRRRAHPGAAPSGGLVGAHAVRALRRCCSSSCRPCSRSAPASSTATARPRSSTSPALGDPVVLAHLRQLVPGLGRHRRRSAPSSAPSSAGRLIGAPARRASCAASSTPPRACSPSSAA